jgi:hypothetical protein
MLGEHIRTRRNGHWVHGIDCGDETVIHLAEDAGRVLRSYRPEFVSRAESVEVVKHRERTFPASEIVARAYSRISDRALAAMFRDSEAFAAWCATGRLPAGPANVAVGLREAATPPAPAGPKQPADPPSAPKRARPRRKAPPAKAARPAAKRSAASGRAPGKAARSGRSAKKAPAAKRAPARKPAKRGAKTRRAR